MKVYVARSSFPKEELLGLLSQIRRSASSIPTNIAEGCDHNSNAEMKRYLTISTGSCSEIEYQIILAKDLGYISESAVNELSESAVAIRRMFHTFVQHLK